MLFILFLCVLWDLNDYFIIVFYKLMKSVERVILHGNPNNIAVLHDLEAVSCITS